MFLTGGRMLLQSVVRLMTKVLLDDKITACVKQNNTLYVSWELYVKFQREKHWLMKSFAFWKRLLSIFY